MEAPPDRPGHVGYSPQDIAGTLARARAQGLAGSSLVIAAPFGPQLLAQRFPRVGSVAQENTRTVMLRAHRAGELLKAEQPWPLAFREGFRIGTAPVSAAQAAREAAAL